jgi:hypothetical protein
VTETTTHPGRRDAQLGAITVIEAFMRAWTAADKALDLDAERDLEAAMLAVFGRDVRSGQELAERRVTVPAALLVELLYCAAVECAGPTLAEQAPARKRLCAYRARVLEAPMP